MKKRLLSFAFAVLCMVIFTLSASAQEAQLTVTPSVPAPGGELTVAIGVEEGSNLAAGELFLSFDTDTFEYVSYESGPLMDNFMNVGNLDKGVFHFAFAADNSITQQGNIVKVVFKVDSDATDSYDFYCYGKGMVDVNHQDVECDEISFTVIPTGTPVTGTDVTPVTVVDDKGNSSVVMATSSEEQVWLSVLIAVVVLVALIGLSVLLVYWAMRSSKKPQKEQKHQSILDEESKKLLDITDDENK